MKKTLAILGSVVAALIILFYAAAYFLAGYSPVYLYHAPSVATGIGAKLACSAHFVSGYDEAKTAEDIAVYSPILALLDYEYDAAAKSVSASLLSLKTCTAHYKKGIGCALDYKGYSVRESITWPAVPSDAQPWPKGNRVDTLNPDLQNKLAELLIEDNANGHDTRALLVAHQGKVVAESYSAGINETTPLLGWSMTKSLTGLLVGHLQMMELLSVYEAGLYEHWQSDQRSAIRIKDLMHMADGLAYDEQYDPGETAVRMLFQEPDAAQYTASLAARNKTGELFSYSSGTTNILMDIVQDRLEGETQADVDYIANEFLFIMGMHSAQFETDAAGKFMGSSYLYATARDWAKLGQLMLNKGEINGRRLVTENYIAESLTPNQTTNDKAYGYQWWLNKGNAKKRWPSLPANSFAAMGNREQRVMVIPDSELIIVRLGWSPKDYRDDEIFAEIRDWFE